MNNQELMSLLESRRTYRRFDESRAIDDETVADMKRSAQLASSAMNRQPLKYIYVRRPDAVNAIFDITRWGSALPDGLGRPREGERPTMFVAVLAVKELTTRFTDFDAGLAVSNITLAAWSHGVGSCVLGSVDCERLREMLEIPDELEIITVVGFGYPTHTSRIVEVSEGEDMKYSLDGQKNYVVPKKSISDTVKDI